jgi:hypothetical protein
MKRNRLREPVKAGSVLGKLLSEFGLQNALSKHALIKLWPKIVDAPIARHAKAERVVGSTLHVIVDSSVWMNELSAVKSVLIEKLNEHVKGGEAAITEIRFQQRSWAKEEPQTHSNTQPQKLTPEDARMVRTLLEPVRDAGVRKVIKRILEKDAILKRTTRSDTDSQSEK